MLKSLKLAPFGTQLNGTSLSSQNNRTFAIEFDAKTNR